MSVNVVLDLLPLASRMTGVVTDMISKYRSVAQLVEHRSPKPKVAGSIPAAPAKLQTRFQSRNRIYSCPTHLISVFLHV